MGMYIVGPFCCTHKKLLSSSTILIQFLLQHVCHASILDLDQIRHVKNVDLLVHFTQGKRTTYLNLKLIRYLFYIYLFYIAYRIKGAPFEKL